MKKPEDAVRTHQTTGIVRKGRTQIQEAALEVNANRQVLPLH